MTPKACLPKVDTGFGIKDMLQQRARAMARIRMIATGSRLIRIHIAAVKLASHALLHLSARLHGAFASPPIQAVEFEA